MKNRLSLRNGIIAGCLAITAAPVLAADGARTNAGYVQINLVSDQAGGAHFTDPRLLNAWGIVAGANSVWVNDNHSGLTTAYTPSGHPFDFAIQVPAPGGGPGAPTGLAFNDSTQFVITNGNRHVPGTFLISTEDGTIAAWNRSSGSNAVIVFDSGGAAVYKGMALARDSSGAPKIYAANFHAGVVDVFDGQFHYLSSFTDSNVPALFAPFNVRAIRGRLFVTFAKQKLPDMKDDEAGPGNGYVDIFDTDGTLLRRLASEGPLNSPWGLAVAPNHFGKFSHSLLVGNFGDGRINAYDLLTGKLLGHLTLPSGDDVVIQGLWGLTFERDERFERDCEFEADRLYFTAGPGGEAHGLFGILRPVNRFLQAAH